MNQLRSSHRPTKLDKHRHTLINVQENLVTQDNKSDGKQILQSQFRRYAWVC